MNSPSPIFLLAASRQPYLTNYISKSNLMLCAWGSIIWSSTAAAGFVPICSLLRSVRQQPLHWHEQWVPRSMALRGAETQRFWAMKCHSREKQSPNSPLLIVWPCLFCCGNPPVECHLWEEQAWVSCGGISLSAPTPLSGGAAWAILTLISLKTRLTNCWSRSPQTIQEQ